jgi:hypothetical protein
LEVHKFFVKWKAIRVSDHEMCHRDKYGAEGRREKDRERRAIVNTRNQ